MSTSPVLEIEALTKSFGGAVALTDGNLELRRGEIHALTGENGAGKSTLIRILSGLLHRDSGTIRVDGKAVEIRNPAAALGLGIAVIPQDFDLPPNLSVVESLLLGREPANRFGFVSARECNRLAQRYLADIGVDIDADTPVGELSVSHRQLVTIARAISTRPRILIMDEPTSALATDEIEKLLDLVVELGRRGTAIIYISHKMEEVFRISNRVTVFRDGASVGTRDATATSVDEIVAMMVGRNLEQLHARAPGSEGRVLLKVRRIHRRGVFAEVSFELRKGEILGIYGLKGAGRSAMIRTLFGLDRLDGGDVLIDGRSVAIDSPRKAIDRGIAFLPEDRHVLGMFPNMSVRENMSIAILDRLAWHGLIDRTSERSLAEECRRQLSIRAEGLDQLISTLSGGNQQKVMLARWLICNPKVLILDEPTAGIDVGARSDIYQLINGLAGDGLGVILVSSELPEILGMSDRLLVMHGGQITAGFTREEATEEKLLRSIHASRDSAVA